jgi:hypothetical protein
LGQDALYLPVTAAYNTFIDSVSLMCGLRDGVTKCGNREIAIWDVDANSEHQLADSTLFEWDQDNSVIVMKTVTDSNFIGRHNYEARVKLTNH